MAETKADSVKVWESELSAEMLSRAGCRGLIMEWAERWDSEGLWVLAI